MFYYPLDGSGELGLSGHPLVRTGIARVRRARLGAATMIKQPGFFADYNERSRCKSRCGRGQIEYLLV